QPFSLLSNWVIVTVESAFSDKLSGVISLGGAYRNTTQNAQQPDAGSWSTTDRTISASIEPGFNYYFQGRAPQGFWLGPRLVFEFQWSQLIANFSPALGDVSNSSNTWRDYTVGGSLLVGYSAIFHSGLTIQVGLGVGATYDWASGALISGGYVPATSAPV